jgi:predicted MPP superfamily phosphohydrolase
MIRTAVGAGAALGVGVLAWSLVEARSYIVRQITVPVLAPGSRPVRVLHLSDIHVTPSQRGKAEWVRSLARFRPDLVINTGDNLAHEDAVPTLLDALGPLLDVPGVFVHGSNDYFGPRAKNPLGYFGGPSKVSHKPQVLPTGDLTAGFTDAGWLDLNNARGTLAVADQRIAFTGLDDPHLERDKLPNKTGRSRTATLRIGVTHAPYSRALEALRSDGADITFAGHTHGGQICVPGYGALVTNCDLPQHKAKGLHGWPGARPDAVGGAESMWLHVSAGIGTSPFTPIRLACRPEASMVTLMPKNG